MGVLNRHLYSVVLSIGSISVCGLAGCNMLGQPTPDAAHAYPTAPPSVKSDTAATGPSTPQAASAAAAVVMKVPADAQELSHGDYPPPAFTVPNQSGSILVVDMDGDPTVAVASTTVNGKDAGKQMSITDVTNISVGMNKLHRYRIVFVPK